MKMEPDDPRRVYAVGDVHGRDDLLDAMIAMIREDARGLDEPARVIFLGDYVDRGLHSREAVERLIALSDDPGFSLRFLKGNHESALLDFLERPEMGWAWLAYGGAETLYSYGVKAPTPGASPDAIVRAAESFRAKLPEAHLAFFKRLDLWARHGRYLFVHAGLRPGKSLEQQREQDLLTIREPFLTSRKRWPFVVVHGHTPEERVHQDERRIGVDTGAYVTGKLSAVRLEGADVRVLQT